MDSFTNDPNIQQTEIAYSVLPIVDQLFRSMNRVMTKEKRSARKEKCNDTVTTALLGVKMETVL